MLLSKEEDMKHLAQIQVEFVKCANWDDLSMDDQREYIKRHPKSKKKVTGKPDQEVWGREKKLLQFKTDGDAREAIDYLKKNGIEADRNSNKMNRLKFVNDAERKKALELLYKHKLYKMVKGTE